MKNFLVYLNATAFELEVENLTLQAILGRFNIKEEQFYKTMKLLKYNEKFSEWVHCLLATLPDLPDLTKLKLVNRKDSEILSEITNTESTSKHVHDKSSPEIPKLSGRCKSRNTRKRLTTELNVMNVELDVPDDIFTDESDSDYTSPVAGGVSQMNNATPKQSKHLTKRAVTSPFKEFYPSSVITDMDIPNMSTCFGLL